MKNLYILELSDIYDNQVRLPYSTGLIWSYCKTFSIIEQNYDLKKWFFYKQDCDDIISQIKDPDVIIFSSSIWNWNLNCKIAKEIKKQFPKVINVCGGPQVPHLDKFYKDCDSTSPYWGYSLKDWFRNNPYFDIISSGEGETSISDLLIENLNECPNFKKIPGFILKDEQNQFHLTGYRERIKDIEKMPSPYLDGSFNDLLEEKYTYTATIETTRGCPFHCTFCDQGKEYFNKIEKMSLGKIKSEIEWCVRNKIFYIDNADSNFGMFYERDMEISKFLVNSKQKYGYPKYYSTAWAKGKTLNSIKIMKVLKESDLDRGANMAFQSLNPKVLKVIKRRNMNDGSIKKTIESFESSNIGVYVELILGLPGETRESFLDGIYELLEMGHHKFIGVYPLQVLPNTEYSDPDYVKEHGLILKKTKTNSAYINPNHNDSEDIMVIGSNSMPYSDWLDCFLYKVLIVGCHSYGPTQFISKYLRSEYGINYKTFYTKLHEWSLMNKETVLYREIEETKTSIINTIEKGTHWNRILDGVSDHTWVHEEALAIMITKNKDKFYSEMKEFIFDCFDIDISSEIITDQYYRLVDPNVSYPINVNGKTYSLNWQRKDFNGDISSWAKECIWWGRKSCRYITKVEK